jgi:hypothetical protein
LTEALRSFVLDLDFDFDFDFDLDFALDLVLRDCLGCFFEGGLASMILTLGERMLLIASS